MVIATLFLVFFTSLLAGVDSLVYDSGIQGGYYTSIRVGDIEAVRFTPMHPCTLVGFSVLVKNQGLAPSNYEFHIWADNGGQMPDTLLDLFPPITGATSGGAQQERLRFDLSSPIVFDPLVDFHIGHKVVSNGIQLFVDNTPPVVQRSTLRMGTDWYYSGGGDYILRAYIVYFDSIPLSRREFENVTSSCNIDATGGRIAWGDFNNDYREDLLINGCKLYKNNGDGTFSDVSREVGLDSNFTSGGIFADYNNDGYLDFYAQAGPPHMDILWKNVRGERFVDATGEANFPSDSYPTEGVAWVDIDNDGFVDLYVANYERPDSMSVGTPDFLWKNNGDGTFSDYSLVSGIRATTNRCGRGVNPCDFDMDGDCDIYVSNYRLNPNFLWVNDGGGRFVNYAREYGVEGTRRYYGGSAYWGHTIGSEWADFDNDLDFDLFTANLAHPRFLAFSDLTKIYVNDGPPDYVFHDIFSSSGIIYQETHSEPAWGDIDNDGDLDIFITCVYEGRRSFMYRNIGGGRFVDVTYETGLMVENGWGAAFCDYDNDGFLDLAVSSNGRILLFRNRGNANNYIKLKLVGNGSNKAAIGAIVKAFAGNLKQMRFVEGGKGTSNQNSLVVHFGLGSNTVLDSILILWPGGRALDRYYNVPANNFYVAEQGSGLFPTGISDERVSSGFIPILELKAIYPNPFNREFVVAYYVGISSFVAFELYNILGAKKKEIYSGFLEKGYGKINLQIDDNDFLSSGVYFLVLRAEKVLAISPVVFLK